MPKFCPECGEKIVGNPKYCPECGNKLLGENKKSRKNASKQGSLQEEKSNKKINTGEKNSLE